MKSTGDGSGRAQHGKARSSRQTGQGREKASGPARHRWDADVIRALDHRQRRQIMRLLHEGDTPVSTAEIAKTLKQPTGRICHHMQVLRRKGLAALVDANRAGETFYLSRVKEQPAVSVFLEKNEEAGAGG